MSTEAVNVPLFGKRVFVDVIKFDISRGDHHGLGWTLNPKMTVLVREE